MEMIPLQTVLDTVQVVTDLSVCYGIAMGVPIGVFVPGIASAIEPFVFRRKIEQEAAEPVITPRGLLRVRLLDECSGQIKKMLFIVLLKRVR
jgi:hypothetical protein